MDYFEIIKKAATITWKNKYLWVLGFIVALAGGGGGNFSNSFNYNTGSADFSQAGQGLSDFYAAYLVIIIFIAAIAALAGLVIWVASIMAQAGLVGSVDRIEQGETPSLAEAFHIGAGNFWRVLGLNIVVGLIVFAMVMIVVVPFGIIIWAVTAKGLDNSAVTGTFICVILAFIVAILAVVVASIVLSVAAIYAVRLIVLEKSGVFASLRGGFALMRKSKGPTFVTFLLVMLVSGLAGSVLAIPGLLIGIPAVVMMIGGLAANNIGLVAMAIFGLIISSLVVACFNGVLEVYRSGVWTLTYRELTKEQI